MTWRRTICTALLAATASCKSFIDLSGPGEDNRLPEILGRRIAPAAACCFLTWTTNAEITFISVDLAAAFAYRPTTGARRTLATIAGGQLYDAAVSADELEAFTTSSGNPRVIRRHTAAGTTVITTAGGGGAGVVYYAAEGRGVLVSPTQAIAAYIAYPDSLFLLRRGGGAVLLGTGCVGLVTFSPDEFRILCMATPNRGSYAVFRLDGGAVQPVALPSSVVGYAQEVHWGAGGIQVLYSGLLANLSLYDVSSASTRILIPGLTELGAGFPDHPSWSRNGRKIAYGMWPCAQTEGFLGCRVAQRHIYVLDFASGVSTRLAVHTVDAIDAGAGQVAISDAGTQIAYTVKEQLYLVDVK